MTSYPDPTPLWALEGSDQLAAHLGAQLSGALCQVHIPEVSNWIADMLLQANEAIQAENAKSQRNARELLSKFSSIVNEDHRGQTDVIDCKSLVLPNEIAKQARYFDLTIIPVIEGRQDHQSMAEGIVFDSGRPVLLLPNVHHDRLVFDHVAIGWDGSRAAARALADALPILRAAKVAQLLRVTGDKNIDPIESLAEVQRHLTTHGIEAQIAEVAAAGRDAGSALMEHCTTAGTDLLIMGAFGHSRVREFVLGGATRSVLDDVRIPVLLSH